MQENNFEKQVQQKMNELQLIPSDAVWKKIEPQIKKEKHRWSIIFFPILFILILFGGYELWHSFFNNQQDAHHHYSAETTKNKENVKPIFQQKNTSRPVTNLPLTAVSKLSIKIISKKESYNLPVNKQLKQTEERNIADTRKDFKININYETKSIAKTENAKQDSNAITKSNILEDQQIISQNFISAADTTLATPVDTAIASNPATNKIDAPTLKQQKDKWNLGINFSTGISGAGNNFLGPQDKNLPSNSSFSSATGSSATGGSPASPSQIKTSTAFITGIVLEKNISRKILFSTGANYKLYSTTNAIGADSAAYFRANGTVSTYHNHFHFIEVPVEFKFMLSKPAKAPIYWNIGISFSQLISSNALQFNSAGLYYYYDNSLFNKFQTNLITGLDARIIKKQSLLVGLYLSYSISKMGSSGYDNFNFTYLGLRVRFFFRKK